MDRAGSPSRLAVNDAMRDQQALQKLDERRVWQADHSKAHRPGTLNTVEIRPSRHRQLMLSGQLRVMGLSRVVVPWMIDLERSKTSLGQTRDEFIATQQTRVRNRRDATRSRYETHNIGWRNALSWHVRRPTIPDPTIERLPFAGDMLGIDQGTG